MKRSRFRRALANLFNMHPHVAKVAELPLSVRGLNWMTERFRNTVSSVNQGFGGAQVAEWSALFFEMAAKAMSSKHQTESSLFASVARYFADEYARIEWRDHWVCEALLGSPASHLLLLEDFHFSDSERSAILQTLEAALGLFTLVPPRCGAHYLSKGNHE